MLKILESLGSIWSWVEGKLLWGLVLFTVYVSIILFLRMRKAIVFDPWMNLSQETPPDLGKGLADLLLFKIREIQNIHQKCIGQIGLWTPYHDVPVFQQDLDEDLRLLSSFDLGSGGEKTGKVMMFLFRLIRLMFQPTKLKGSIHQYGNDVLLQVTLERFKNQASGPRGTQVWYAKGKSAAPEQFPELVEEIAYQIYVELVGSSLFKSWRSFRDYTNGLEHYLAHKDIGKKKDLAAAQSLYQKALDEEPNNPAVCYNLGVLKYFSYEQEENEEAIEYFREAVLSGDPDLRVRAHSGLANALVQQYSRYCAGDANTPGEAILHAEQAIAIDPSSDVANKALGFAYHQQSEVDGLNEHTANQYRELAKTHYEKAFTRNPKYYEAYNNLGNLYLGWADKPPKGKRAERLAKAIKMCERALGVEPTYRLAYDNIGNAYFKLKNFCEAERYYKLALQYYPGYPEAINDLAMLYLTAGFPDRNFSQALTLHNQALSKPKLKETQKKKLCRAFHKSINSEPGSPDQFKLNPRLVESLQKSDCSCVPAV